MSQVVEKTVTADYTTFFVQDQLFAIPIMRIREINRDLQITRVPFAPHMVSGIMNLRGEIVTTVHLGFLLGLKEDAHIDQKSRIIVMEHHKGSVGFVIDAIDEVITVSGEDVEPVPSNMKGQYSEYCSGVYRLNDSIVMLIDPDKLIKDEDSH